MGPFEERLTYLAEKQVKKGEKECRARYSAAERKDLVVFTLECLAQKLFESLEERT